MSEKVKELLPEQKLWAVKEYLSEKDSSIADKYGVTDTSIRRWVDRYKIDGELAYSTSVRPPRVRTITFLPCNRHIYHAGFG